MIKSRWIGVVIVVALGVWLAAGPAAWAANYTWDTTTGDSAITDGGGTWQVGVGNWHDGASYDQVWSNGNVANFGSGTNGSGTAGTVLLGSNVSPSTLTFNTPKAGSYTIDLKGFTLTVPYILGNSGFGSAQILDSVGTGSMTAPVSGVTLSGTLTIGAKITGANGIYTGNAGNLTLTNSNNDFTGLLGKQNAGALTFASIKNSGVASAAGAGNEVQVGYNAQLQYTGSGDTTDRKLNLFGTGNATLLNNGSGVLTWMGVVTNTSVASRTFYLGGSNTGTNELKGVLADNGANVLSVTKQDAGKWILSGTNTYTGATTISGGTLGGVAGGGCANSAVTVNNTAGCTLTVIVNDNTKQWTCGSLTAAGANATFQFSFGTNPSTNVAPLRVLGNLTFTGVPAISVDPTNLVAGQSYPLMVVDGTATSAVPLVSIGLGWRGKVAWGGAGSKTLILSTEYFPPPLHWGSSGSGTWDINVSTNWKDNVGTAATYANGDAVQLDDTYIAGDTTVTVTNTVSPYSVVVDNSTYNYTLTNGGGAAISGSTGLDKRGSGTLTLCAANTYAGNTTISNGVLKLGAGNVMPDGSGKGNLVLSPSSGTATFDLSGFDETINGLTSSGAGASVIDHSMAAKTNTLTIGNNNANGAFSGSIANSAGMLHLTKTGSGTQTLSGTSTYTGNTTLFGGTLTVSGSIERTYATYLYGSAVLDIAGGAFTGTYANVRCLDIGAGGGQVGTVRVSGSGSLSVPGMLLGEDSGGTAFFDQRGGAVSVGDVIMCGNTSTLTVSNGTFTSSGNLFLAGAATVLSTSTLNVSGSGSINASQLLIGYYGRNFATATVNLGNGSAGGTLKVNNFVYFAGTGTNALNFNGGTLVANATFGLSTQIVAVVQSGGANFNVLSNYTLTVTTALTDGGGGGGVAKSGSGTLTLAGTNTYTGITAANAGTLYVSGLLSSNSFLSASNGALLQLKSDMTCRGLGGGGTVSNGTLTVTGAVAPGDTTNAVGAVNMQGNLTLASGVTNVTDFISGSADLVTVSGTLTVSGGGTVRVDLHGQEPPSYMTLFTFGSLVGESNLGSWTVAGTDFGKLQTRLARVGNTIVLKASMPGTLIMVQ